MIKVIAYADPATQGSKQGFAIRSGPQCQQCKRRRLNWRPGTFCYGCQQGVPVIALKEDAEGLQKWRGAVYAAATVVMLNRDPLAGPLQVSMTFTLDRPKSHYTKSGGLSAEGKRAPYPSGLGRADLSKLCRATEDALTDAKVWHDDGQVAEYARLAKVWPAGYWDSRTATLKGVVPSSLSGIPEADALPKPGVVVRVTELIPPQPELTFDDPA